MRYLLLIILFYSALSSCAQFGRVKATQPFAYIPTIGRELGTVSYKVQQSTNNHNWTTITQILPRYLPDSNLYIIQLPNPTTSRYYRIIAVMQSSQYIGSTIYIKVPK